MTLEPSSPAPAPAPQLSPPTVFATAAVNFADLFSERFSRPYRLGLRAYRVVVQRPLTNSTGRGTQAVQHISLQPMGAKDSIVIGAVDQLRRIAELKGYEVMRALQSRRARSTPIGFDERAYDEVLGPIEAFLLKQGIKVRRLTMPGTADENTRSNDVGASLITAAVAFAALVAGVLTGLALFTRLG